MKADLINRVKAIADRMLGLPTMFDNDELTVMDEVLEALDAKGSEPVGFIPPHGVKELAKGYPQTITMSATNKYTVPLYASPPSREGWVLVPRTLFNWATRHLSGEVTTTPTYADVENWRALAAAPKEE